MGRTPRLVNWRRIFWILIAGVFVMSTTFGWNVFQTGPPKLPRAPDLAERLTAHVRMLSERIGVRDLAHLQNLLQAEAYIREQWTAAGYTVTAHEYAAHGVPSRNLIAERPGRDPAKPVVIFSAHYDSCGTPGADDNASGIAVLLELAGLIAGTQPGRTVRFIAFVNEEPPLFRTALMGSRVYARALKQQGGQVEMMVSLEMLGYYSNRVWSQRYPPLYGLGRPPQGDFIGLVGRAGSGPLIKRIAAAFRRGTDFPLQSTTIPEFVPGVTWSDHWSFWQEGYPAAMLTDTAFLRNPHYHASSDTWDTLDYVRMSQLLPGLQDRKSTR